MTVLLVMHRQMAWPQHIVQFDTIIFSTAGHGAAEHSALQSPSVMSARPPSPERPPTPSSRPARRRHLITAATQDVPSPLMSPSWAGSNRKFAPMPQSLSWDPAPSLAAVRPASASIAETHDRQVGLELDWTGSMQLPAGLLKLTVRPQAQNAGRKGKHQYDWGFGNARGLV